MKSSVDYLLVGTGAAPLLAAQRLSNRGDSVLLLNPDTDFFLENSELPLDLLGFETPNSDLSKRFQANLTEEIYKNLITEFPGAVELWKQEDEKRPPSEYQVESAPWIRSRHRLWVVPENSDRVDQLETLYLRALDLGWKPKWMEGASLAKRFPGFSARNLEARGLEKCVGFLGPRFGDVDVARYRTGLLEFVRERLGRENVLTSAHVLSIDTKGVRFQLASGNPSTLKVDRAVLFFWTPKLERMLRQKIEKYQPRALGEFEAATRMNLWEDWNIVSRDPVDPSVVAHLDRVRVWSYGEGSPPAGGWNQVKVMRKCETDLLSDASFQDLSKVMFDFLGWERFTVRNMCPRSLYRWNSTMPIEFDADGVRSLIITACDGPMHWIAQQVRQTIDGV